MPQGAQPGGGQGKVKFIHYKGRIIPIKDNELPAKLRRGMSTSDNVTRKEGAKELKKQAREASKESKGAAKNAPRVAAVAAGAFAASFVPGLGAGVRFGVRVGAGLVGALAADIAINAVDQKAASKILRRDAKRLLSGKKIGNGRIKQIGTASREARELSKMFEDNLPENYQPAAENPVLGGTTSDPNIGHNSVTPQQQSPMSPAEATSVG